MTIIPIAENHREFRPCFHVDDQTEYSRLQGHALYLEPDRRSVLWTVKTDWNNHRRWVSNAIDAFEPSIERQTAAIQRETRDFAACSTPCCESGQDILGNVEMGSPIPPTIFSRIAPSDYHLFRLMAHGLADQHFRSYEEVKNWIDSLIASKDDQFFRRGIRTLPERWEKVVASDGQYFES